MGCLILSERQRKLANQLLEEIDSEVSPSSLVDEWREMPSTIEYDDYNERMEYVCVDDIVGTEASNINRLEVCRLRRIVEKMLSGEFEKEHRLPPVLCVIDGEYFVDADGNHRTLAHKYIGISEMYAEVIEFI